MGIKHHPEQTQIYWFEVPESLCTSVKIGDEVLCDTRRGHQTGIVTSIAEGLEQNKVQQVIGVGRFPLKKVIAVKISIEIDKIHIPFDMQAGGVNIGEVHNVMEEYYKNGFFPGEIKFSTNNDLIQGYSEYLVAKMFDHGVLSGFCYAE